MHDVNVMTVTMVASLHISGYQAMFVFTAAKWQIWWVRQQLPYVRTSQLCNIALDHSDDCLIVFEAGTTIEIFWRSENYCTGALYQPGPGAMFINCQHSSRKHWCLGTDVAFTGHCTVHYAWHYKVERLAHAVFEERLNAFPTLPSCPHCSRQRQLWANCLLWPATN